MARIAPRLVRVEPRRRARAFLLGLLAGLPRTNCWTIAEHAGEASPDGMQHLLTGAVWDADAVRDDLRGYVVDQLSDPDTVLVVDETGDLKKGTASRGAASVHRHRGPGRERPGRGLLGLRRPGRVRVHRRALYLPKFVDRRCRAVRCRRVPDEVAFATKPAQATQMIARALDAGTPARWATGDEVYGADPGLRKELVGRRLGYVLAVAKDHPISTGIGTRRAGELAGRLPKRAWQHMSAGAGAKGERFYDWALLDTVDAAADPDRSGCHWLLLRRSRRTGELGRTPPARI
jgi:SRSO17 transposase